MLAVGHRGVAVLVGSLHQVDARQILVARHHSREVFARDTHEVGQTCARSHKDSSKALILELLHAHGLAHDAVLYEVNTHLPQVVNFKIHNTVGQTELGYAIF